MYSQPARDRQTDREQYQESTPGKYLFVVVCESEQKLLTNDLISILIPWIESLALRGILWNIWISDVLKVCRLIADSPLFVCKHLKDYTLRTGEMKRRKAERNLESQWPSEPISIVIQSNVTPKVELPTFDSNYLTVPSSSPPRTPPPHSSIAIRDYWNASFILTGSNKFSNNSLNRALRSSIVMQWSCHEEGGGRILQNLCVGGRWVESAIAL